MAKEGFYFYLPFVLLAAIFFYIVYQDPQVNYLYLAAASLAIGNLVLLFFRDPKRKVPEGDNLIVSPADGKVIAIEEHDDCRQVSIFLSIFNVHVNRIPVSGIVESVERKKGKYKAAFNKQASKINNRVETEINSDNGPVRVHQVSGMVARRIICRVKHGQNVKKGDKLGLIMFGSRVDLFVPLNASIEISVGKWVYGAKTVIGRFE